MSEPAYNVAIGAESADQNVKKLRPESEGNLSRPAGTEATPYCK